MSKVQYEPTEVEYIEQLMDDFSLSENSTIGDLLEALEEEEAESKHKRNKRVRVSIGAPWKRRSMLAMSQLGHYVNRRNVQAAVSQVWPFFSVGGDFRASGCISHCGRRGELFQSIARRTDATAGHRLQPERRL